MRGFPLNNQLGKHAQLIEKTTTSEAYKLYKLDDKRPALVRTAPQDEDGVKIEIEVYKLENEAVLGQLLLSIPQPLGLGKIELEDGKLVTGFICVHGNIISHDTGVEDISDFKSWRKYKAATDDAWLCQSTAVEVIEMLKTKYVTPERLIQVVERRVADVNPQIHAVVTPCFSRARSKLRELEERMSAMTAFPPGFLYGLPVLIKDTSYVHGVRFSLGFYTQEEDEEHVKKMGLTDSDPLVLQLEQMGGLVVGKTNLSEFAAGGHSFNNVFPVRDVLSSPSLLLSGGGVRTSEEDVTLRIVTASFVLLFLCSNTDLFVFSSLRTFSPHAHVSVASARMYIYVQCCVNPHDTRMSAGGSSGGAGAALAAKLGWLAQGSDRGGSVRLPAHFNGIVGLRASPGIVMQAKPCNPRYGALHSMNGPMARTVEDCALFLDAMMPSSPDGESARPLPGWENYPASALPAARSTTWLEIARAGMADASSLNYRVAFSTLKCSFTRAEVVECCVAAATMLAGGANVDVMEEPFDIGRCNAIYSILRADGFLKTYGHMDKEDGTAKLTLAQKSRLKPETKANAALAERLEAFGRSDDDGEFLAVKKAYEV